MYKLVKWAYELGQKQERQRIKLEISRIQAQLHIQHQYDNIRITEVETLSRSATNKKRLKALEEQQSVNEIVTSILGRLTQPEGKWVEEGTAPIDGGNK